jgi:hypothetical protein
VAGTAAGVAFLLGAPYTVLNLPAFLNAFGYLSTAYANRDLLDGAQIYMGHLQSAGGWPVLIAIVAGLVWGPIRAIRDRAIARWALLLVFPVGYFYMIATKQLIFARYLLPILPFLHLLIAVVVVDVVRRLWPVAAPRIGVRMSPVGWARACAAIALPVAVGLTLARNGLAWPQEYGRRTTQDFAYRMLVQFIPEGSGVAVERSVLRLPDSMYRPMVVPRLTDRSPEQYVESGVTYVIATSDVYGPIFENRDRHPDSYAAYQRLFGEEGERCLPTVEPTATASGPRIRICRLQTEHGQ